jgi:hypothetical protein
MVRTLWRVFGAVLAATVLLQLFIPARPHFEVEALFAFNAVYGFLACAALILAAKAIGLFVKRKDTYYDDE